MTQWLEQEIERVVETLKSGGVILYPTDTIWGLGCDATNDAAVKRIGEIKGRPDDKGYIIIVDSIEMLHSYLKESPGDIPDIFLTGSRPTTLIFENPAGVAPRVLHPSGTIAIRIVRDEFCREMIKRFGKAVVSTSANISGQAPPASFKDISPRIIGQCDYVVHYKRDVITSGNPSRIVRIKAGGKFDVIRE